MSFCFASLARAAFEVAPEPCIQSGFCPPQDSDFSGSIYFQP